MLHCSQAVLGPMLLELTGRRCSVRSGLAPRVEMLWPCSQEGLESCFKLGIGGQLYSLPLCPTFAPSNFSSKASSKDSAYRGSSRAPLGVPSCCAMLSCSAQWLHCHWPCSITKKHLNTLARIVTRCLEIHSPEDSHGLSCLMLLAGLFPKHANLPTLPET